MTQIEYQNAINSFLKIEDNHILIKDLNIADDIIKINVSDKPTDLAGIQVLRGNKPPLNIIWNEQEETLYFTVGKDLANVKMSPPPLKISDMVDDYFVHDDDIILVKIKNKKLYLPKLYNKILRIKVIFGPVTVCSLSGDYLITLEEGTTHHLAIQGDKWVEV